MLTKSKLLGAVVVASLIATPAFAQAFSSSYGTGNVTPAYNDQDGKLHAGVAPLVQGNQVAVVHRSGENAFASISRAPSGIDSPALTGGGSVGYNEGLRTNEY